MIIRFFDFCWVYLALFGVPVKVPRSSTLIQQINLSQYLANSHLWQFSFI